MAAEGARQVIVDTWSYHNHAYTADIAPELSDVMDRLYAKGIVKVSACEARDGKTITISVSVSGAECDYCITETVESTNAIMLATVANLLKEASNA